MYSEQSKEKLYREWSERKVDLSTGRKEKEIFLEGENKKKSLKKQLLMLAKSPPSRDENQLSDSADSKETVGSSWKKMKYADEELLLDSSDEEYTFNTEENEGYRLINVKNLFTAVSKAHVCEKGENFFEISVFLCSRL